MKLIIDTINEAILDVCISPLTESGIFNPDNDQHIYMLIERLDQLNVDEKIISKAVSALRKEGKYPDRQAFNKDGWLVTFPSADYRSAAIKKGTHFTTDPTHGKGGMHLYYKSKGKQARQAHQDVSATDPVTGQPISAPDASAPEKVAAPQAPGSAPAEKLPAASGDPTAAATPDSTAAAGSDSALPPAGEDPTSTAPAGGAASAAGGAGAAPAAPAAPTPPPAPAAPSVVDLSKQFASEKGWSSTPYGDWNDRAGKKTAVSSLSSEVVPIEHVDREALKTFVDKKSKV